MHSVQLLQAYVRSHVTQAIYVLDFLKQSRAKGGSEKDRVEEFIAALTRLHTQVGRSAPRTGGVHISSARSKRPLGYDVPTDSRRPHGTVPMRTPRSGVHLGPFRCAHRRSVCTRDRSRAYTAGWRALGTPPRVRTDPPCACGTVPLYTPRANVHMGALPWRSSTPGVHSGGLPRRASTPGVHTGPLPAGTPSGGVHSGPLPARTPSGGVHSGVSHALTGTAPVYTPPAGALTGTPPVCTPRVGVYTGPPRCALRPPAR